jgi:hypothetical protein
MLVWSISASIRSLITDCTPSPEQRLGYRFIVRSGSGFLCLVAGPPQRRECEDGQQIAFYTVPRRRGRARQAVLIGVQKTIVSVPRAMLNRTITLPVCDLMTVMKELVVPAGTAIG